MSERRVIVLGSTGSIGVQALEVIRHLNAEGNGPRLRVVGLAAGRNAALLGEQAAALGVRELAICEGRVPGARVGTDAAVRLVREVECDLVVAAMVGAAGIPTTLAAVELGRDIALANKETLVAAGGQVVAAAKKSGSRLLPVDSEHSGIWQCLAAVEPGCCPPMSAPAGVRRVTLTASGGPFRTWSKQQIAAATPEQALRHPTWTMGRKVTIDSATLMNKTLELIEAHWLFGLPADKLGVVIHPQSIVHAIVELADGSTLTQLGAPDMRTPIQLALTWPHRRPGLALNPSLAGAGRLEFEEPDEERFPALRLARRVIEAGGNAGEVLNAANEEAVALFLAGEIAFPEIAARVSAAVERAFPAHARLGVGR